MIRLAQLAVLPLSDSILYSATSEQRRQAHLGRDETGVRRKIPPHALTIAGTQSWDLDEVVAEALKT
jgi:hypothetical protein